MNFIAAVSGTARKKSKSNPVPISPPIESIETLYPKHQMQMAHTMFSMRETRSIVFVFLRLIEPVLSMRNPMAIPIALTPP